MTVARVQRVQQSRVLFVRPTQNESLSFLKSGFRKGLVIKNKSNKRRLV